MTHDRYSILFNFTDTPSYMLADIDLSLFVHVGPKTLNKERVLASSAIDSYAASERPNHLSGRRRPCLHRTTTTESDSHVFEAPHTIVGREVPLVEELAVLAPGPYLLVNADLAAPALLAPRLDPLVLADLAAPAKLALGLPGVVLALLVDLRLPLSLGLIEGTQGTEASLPPPPAALRGSRALPHKFMIEEEGHLVLVWGTQYRVVHPVSYSHRTDGAHRSHAAERAHGVRLVSGH